MQLEMTWRDENGLKAELERLTGISLDITLTDNTSTMLSVRRGPGRGTLRVRLHRMFLAAEPRVIRALADWLSKPRSARSSRVLDDFVEQNRHRIRSARARRRNGRTSGDFHDLERMFTEVNETMFGDQVTAPVMWGRMPARKRRRSIRFGSYSNEDHVIRIHPLLDQAFVPDYVVRFIVFHEMLHAFLGVKKGENGRRQVHTPEFRRLEKAYPDYERATKWLDDPAHLARLLNNSRSAGAMSGAGKNNAAD